MADGNRIPLWKMDSRHLFNSLRMVFNHKATKENQISGGKRYGDISGWPDDYCYSIMKAMIKELYLRCPELPEEEWKDINAIAVLINLKAL